MKNLFIATYFSLLLLQPADIFAASSLEDRVSELEARQALNIFDFGASLRAQYNSVSLKNSGRVQIYTLHTTLKANANINERLKFYSTFAMSKFWNNQLEANRADTSATIQDLYSSKRFEDNRVRVERAYADYFVTDNLAVSFGRLPTAGGPPLNYYDDLARQSTYHMLTYDAELDGVALTYTTDASLLPKGHEGSLRMVYTPFTNVNFNTEFSPLTDPTGVDDDKPSADHYWSFLLEYNVEGVKKLISDWNFYAQYTFVDGASFADVAGVVNYPKEMLDLSFISLGSEFRRIAGLNLDLYAAVLVSRVDNKKLAQITLPVAKSIGYRKNTLGTVSATSLLFTLKYKTSINMLNMPTLGVEYFQGGKDGVFATELNLSESITGFYGTMGKSYHVFYLQPVYDNFSIRLGYRHQERDFKPEKTFNLNLGESAVDEETLKTIYLTTLVSF